MKVLKVYFTASVLYLKVSQTLIYRHCPALYIHLCEPKNVGHIQKLALVWILIYTTGVPAEFSGTLKALQQIKRVEKIVTQTSMKDSPHQRSLPTLARECTCMRACIQMEKQRRSTVQASGLHEVCIIFYLTAQS